MKKQTSIMLFISTLLVILGYWAYAAINDETYEGMSIIPEQHEDIPLYAGLEARRHDYVIKGNQWEDIYKFYTKELPERSWKTEYEQAEESWAGFMSHWSKQGFDGNLSIGAYYDEFNDQTKVIFDKIGVVTTSVWIVDAGEEISVCKHPQKEGCLVINDKETIDKIVKMINFEAFNTDQWTAQKIYGSIVFREINVQVHFSKDEETIYLKSEKGIKRMKPDPDFFKLTNLVHLNSN